MFFDTHLDLLFDVVLKRRLGEKEIIKNHHLPFLKSYDGVAATMYFEGGNQPEELQEALKAISDEVEESASIFQVARTKHDLTNAGTKLLLLLAIEGLAPVRSISDIDAIFSAGIRQISLTWNDNNLLASGGKQPTGGLTTLGKEVVKRFLELGGIIDISHAGQQTAEEILTIADRNVIASHSNAAGLYPHFRNLSDSLIIQLVAKGGLIGLSPAYFVADKDKRNIDSFIDHIDYVRKLVGIDAIAIGTDFLFFLPDYSGAAMPELASPADLPLLINGLEKRGYSPLDIEKITGRNYLNFLLRSLS